MLVGRSLQWAEYSCLSTESGRVSSQWLEDGATDSLQLPRYAMRLTSTGLMLEVLQLKNIRQTDRLPLLARDSVVPPEMTKITGRQGSDSLDPSFHM